MQSERDKEIDRHPPPSPTSITACLRCREQKLKCDRVRPVCARCRRLSANCAWPAPPDRRGPRGKRKQRSLRVGARGGRDSTGPGQHPNAGAASPETPVSGEHVLNERPAPKTSASGLQGPRPHSVEDAAPIDDAVGYTSPGLVADYPVLSGSYQCQLRKSTSLARESTLESDQPHPLPPTSLGLALLEIYFARIYNASVMFHKPFLFQQYIEGKVHVALLRAMFAMATLFLHPRNKENTSTTTSNEELRILSVYQPSGLAWAKAALNESMQLVTQSPSLMAVQALQCVQLYWFGVGKPQSGDMCLALAYRSCQVLGYDKRLPNEDDSSSGMLELEFGRRCFWACWISTCIVMEPEPYVDSAWKEAAMLPLPGSISSGPQGYRVTYNQLMDKYWHAISVQPQSSMIGTRRLTAPGSFIKIIGVWAKVQLLCKDRPLSITSGELTSVHHFSHLATILFQDATSTRDTYPQDYDTIEAQNLCLFHDAVYHQCQIVLHSLIVPLFSGIPADRNIDNHRQEQIRAAETVMNHADLFARLLAPYLRGEEDVSRLPPLIGYGAFVVGMVFLSTEAARRNQVTTEVPVDTDKNGDRLLVVRDIVRALDILRASWRALQQPWEVLSSALQPYSSKLSGPRHEQAPPGSKDQDLPKTTERPDQSANANNVPLQNPDTGGNMRNHTVDARNSAMSLTSDGFALSGSIGNVANAPYTGQPDLFADSDWYGLSLAEAGVEQLVGCEPSSLFLQGWNTFS
ncbi:hypothetical protein BB8028_0006g10460 [Beauveria bassiana]|uniref:Zn(2)-C6 fungal-type domain-containing protein n=1 Tax=Beauveria bassiana TaxID=176275 RepID=A0A2S7YKV9_BEABA|nr:hypothetical protein BB8028_0006g10460 [Beauveria bassiana]